MYYMYWHHRVSLRVRLVSFLTRVHYSIRFSDRLLTWPFAILTLRCSGHSLLVFSFARVFFSIRSSDPLLLLITFANRTIRYSRRSLFSPFAFLAVRCFAYSAFSLLHMNTNHLALTSYSLLWPFDIVAFSCCGRSLFRLSLLWPFAFLAFRTFDHSVFWSFVLLTLCHSSRLLGIFLLFGILILCHRGLLEFWPGFLFLFWPCVILAVRYFDPSLLSPFAMSDSEVTTNPNKP